MKYKVGDKVRVKSKDWYDKNRSWHGYFTVDGLSFVDEMVRLCGKEAMITHSDGNGHYKLDINDLYWFSDGMLEDPNLANSRNTGTADQLIKDIANVIKKHNSSVSVSEKDGKLIIEPLVK